MAYCKSCGAYIPDGQTACLACGYNDSEKKKTSGTSSGAAAAAAKAPEKTASGTTRNEKYKQVDSNFLKQQLEEQRRRQQENSRKWAETEYAQRQKAKEEQTRNFTSTSGRSGSDVYRTIRSTMESDDVGKVMAGLSYFSILFLLPYLFRDKDKFATYHAKQGMNLFAAGIIADIAGKLLGIGWFVWIARLYMIFKGVSNVAKGEKKPLPYIGNLIK